MKSSDLKVVAIILSIALFFTIITSNAVSIASVVILAKGGTGATVSTDVPQGTVQQGTSTTPGGTTSTPSGTTSTTPGGTTSTTPDGSTSTTPGGTTSTTPGGTTSTTPGGSTSTTPDANKPADNNQPAGQSKSAKECLEIYTKVMNKAKADKPAYTKVEYQELPSDANSRVISEGSGLVGTLLNLVDSLGIMTSKEAAEADPEIKEAGSDMRWFPVYKCEKGCYLTDVSAIKSYKYEDLGNNQAKVTIVLNDEKNPEPMAEGASSSPSNTGAMFSPLAKADIDNTINGGAVSAVIKNVTFSLTYHDCTAIIVYNTKTNELISLEQYMNVSIQGGGKIAGIKQITIDRQELINTVRCTDFKY